MQRRTALIAAIVSGVLAVSIVAVDLQFGLEAELQVMEDGEWVSITEDRSLREPGAGCVGRDLRLYVDNHRLFASTVDVSVTYYSLAGEQVVVLSDTWELGPNDVQFHAFSIPDSAFVPRSDGNETPQKPGGGYTVSVNAYANDIYLYTCVAEATE